MNLLCCRAGHHFNLTTPMKPLLLAASLLLTSVSTFAQQNCDKPRDDFDGLYCLNKIYIETDAELNEVYKELAPRLPAEGKSKLKESQLAWIEERNSSCSKKLDTGFYVNLACATRSTRSRLQLLQERVRECKSSGCQPSKL
jgi:uncharacterized protein YecT (DUF1311 family)